MIAIIGPGWLNILNQKTRANDEPDWMRIEVEAALKRNFPVIPVRVNGANMPAAVELPESLRALAYRQSIEVRSGKDSQPDIDELIEAIGRYIKRRNLVPVALGCGVALATGLYFLHPWENVSESPHPTPTPNPLLIPLAPSPRPPAPVPPAVPAAVPSVHPGDRLNGIPGSSAAYGSSWLNLEMPITFERGTCLNLTVSGGRILVRLLPAGQSADDPVGIIGPAVAVPQGGQLVIRLDRRYENIIQISVHGSPRAFNESLGDNNPPAHLQGVSVVSCP